MKLAFIYAPAMLQSLPFLRHVGSKKNDEEDARILLPKLSAVYKGFLHVGFKDGLPFMAQDAAG
jgi:hypothetical protein